MFSQAQPCWEKVSGGQGQDGAKHHLRGVQREETKGNGKRTQHQNVLRGGECSSGIRDSNILQPGKLHKGLPMRRRGKEPACQCKRCKFNPRAGKVSGEGNGHPTLDSCLGNPVARGPRQATVCGVPKSRTPLSTHANAIQALHGMPRQP